jgi:hypothetical protein
MGVQMRAILLLVACLISEASFAETQCSSVPKASDRLACYDKLSPPRTGTPDPKKLTSAEPELKDMGAALAKENARLDAKIKNICRGC